MEIELVLEKDDLVQLFEQGYTETKNGTRVAIPEDGWLDAIVNIENLCQN